ncbi:MAG: FapA family protein [Pseudomonadota bacterium]|nr:FapA family protein [Pseudomonadota bacterium]
MIQVQTSNDRLKASVEIIFESAGETPLTADEIRSALTDHQVTAGIDDQAIEVFCQQAKANPGQPIKGIVAHGTPLTATIQPNYQFKFSTRKSIGQVLESGKIDYRDRGMINFTKSGTLLLDVIPGKAGISGLQVDGTITEAEDLEPLKKINAGKNVKLETTDEGHLHYLAQADGQADLQGSELVIENMFTVDGNVDLNTGHIKYQGPIHVTGNLLSGFAAISNSDVFIDKLIDGGSVKAKGDLVVGTGIIGSEKSSITVLGNIKSEYIASLGSCQAKGSIVVEKHVINSTLVAGGAIRCAGKITGECSISAFSGIETGELGSEGSSRTTVEVGNDIFIRERLQKIDRIMEPMIERSIEIVDLVSLPVIMKKDPSMLPAERQEEAAELINEYHKIDSQITLLKKKKTELEEKSAAARQARITVHQQVYPGVLIRIGHETYQVDKPLSGPIAFWLDPVDRKITTR